MGASRKQLTTDGTLTDHKSMQNLLEDDVMNLEVNEIEVEHEKITLLMICPERYLILNWCTLRGKKRWRCTRSMGIM